MKENTIKDFGLAREPRVIGYNAEAVTEEKLRQAIQNPEWEKKLKE